MTPKPVTVRPDQLKRLSRHVRDIPVEVGPRGLLQAWDLAGPQRTQRELAHQLRRLADLGVPEVDEAALAADRSLLLTSGAVSERRYYDAASLSAPARTALITAGVRAFPHGHLPRRSC